LILGALVAAAIGVIALVIVTISRRRKISDQNPSKPLATADETGET